MINQKIILFVFVLLSTTIVYAQSDNHFQFLFVSEEACSDCEKVFDINSDEHIWIEKKMVLADKDIKDAEVKINQKFQFNSSPTIFLKLTELGKEKFADITSRNIGRRLAVFVGKKYVMSPEIREVIASGEIVITGPISLEEAESIVKKFKASVSNDH
jgi:preprotein translocase subunit SecD